MSLISFSEIVVLGMCIFWIFVIAQVGWFFAKRHPDQAKSVAKTTAKVIWAAMKKQ